MHTVTFDTKKPPQAMYNDVSLCPAPHISNRSAAKKFNNDFSWNDKNFNFQYSTTTATDLMTDAAVSPAQQLSTEKTISYQNGSIPLTSCRQLRARRASLHIEYPLSTTDNNVISSQPQTPRHPSLWDHKYITPSSLPFADSCPLQASISPGNDWSTQNNNMPSSASKFGRKASLQQPPISSSLNLQHRFSLSNAPVSPNKAYCGYFSLPPRSQVEISKKFIYSNDFSSNNLHQNQPSPASTDCQYSSQNPVVPSQQSASYHSQYRRMSHQPLPTFSSSTIIPPQCCQQQQPFQHSSNTIFVPTISPPPLSSSIPVVEPPPLIQPSCSQTVSPTEKQSIISPIPVPTAVNGPLPSPASGDFSHQEPSWNNNCYFNNDPIFSYKSNKNLLCAKDDSYYDLKEQRRKKFLERNRLAAHRCRQKKKQWVQDLEKKLDVALYDNVKLLSTISALESNLSELKFKVQNCRCDVPPANNNVSPSHLQQTLDINTASSNMPSNFVSDTEFLVGINNGSSNNVSSNNSTSNNTSSNNTASNNSYSNSSLPESTPASPQSTSPTSRLHDYIPHIEQSGCYFYA